MKWFERLFAVAPDAASMVRLRGTRIARLIYPAGFYRTKARRILEISRILLDAHGGRVPYTIEALLELGPVILAYVLSFAMLAVGDDSRLVHRGDAAFGVKVRSIEADAVVLTAGGTEVRCELH